MGGRAPVILKNGEYWGLITVTIDFDNMMDVIGLDNLRGMGVDYSLSYIDDAGNANYLYGNTDLGKDAVKTRFAIRNLTFPSGNLLRSLTIRCTRPNGPTTSDTTDVR